MKARILSLLFLFFGLSLPTLAEMPMGPIPFADEASGGSGLSNGLTMLLSAPVVAKIALSAVLLPTAFTGVGASGAPALLCFAWSLPNSILLLNIVQGNAAGIRLWRTVNLVVDSAIFATWMGLGFYAIAQSSYAGDDFGKQLGTVFIAVSIPFGASAGIDLIPFPAEGGGGNPP